MPEGVGGNWQEWWWQPRSSVVQSLMAGKTAFLFVCFSFWLISGAEGFFYTLVTHSRWWMCEWVWKGHREGGREEKRQERRYIYVFWLRQNSVSQLWTKIHFRYIQIKAKVKDMSQIVWKLWMLLFIFNKLCFCMSCSMQYLYIYMVVCKITF